MACWIRVEEDIDFWSISSDKLLFFKIGFFDAKELVRERPFAAEDESQQKYLLVLF